MAAAATVHLLLTTSKYPKSTLINQSAQGSFLRQAADLHRFATTFHKGSKKLDLVVRRNVAPEAAGDLLSSMSLPEIPGFHLPGVSDNSWLAGIIGLCVTLPLLVQRVLSLTKEIDMAAHTVEKIADAVEHVAEEVDKAAEGIAEALPEGGLKQMVHFVEELAEETAKDAHKVEELMDKVEEIDEKLEDFIGKQFNGPKKA